MPATSPPPRKLIKSRPELVGMDMAENDEHRALHFAVLRRDPAMVRLLDARPARTRAKAFFRTATRLPPSPWRATANSPKSSPRRGGRTAPAPDREVPQRRRLPCPGPDQPGHPRDDNEAAIALLTADPALVRACDRNGATPSTPPRRPAATKWSHGCSPAAPTRIIPTCNPSLPSTTPPSPPPIISLPSPTASSGPARPSPSAPPSLWQPRSHPRIRPPRPKPPAQHRSARRLLSLAVRHGQLETIRLLLDLGANVDERTLLENLEEPFESAGKPLWLAADLGRRDIAELLLDRGANPNANLYASGWPSTAPTAKTIRPCGSSSSAAAPSPSPGPSRSRTMSKPPAEISRGPRRTSRQRARLVGCRQRMPRNRRARPPASRLAPRRFPLALDSHAAAAQRRR